MQDDSSTAPPSTRDEFNIAVICALPEQRDTVEALMTRDYRDERRRYGKAAGDENSYTLGELGGKPVVLVAARDVGVTNTRDLARQIRFSFPNISYALLVGICGGAPFLHNSEGWVDSDIHLGDVVVSTQVIPFDFGREYDNAFVRKSEIESTLPRAPAEITNFVNRFVRGRGNAFKRLSSGTNLELSECKELETSGGGFHAYPGSGTDRVYDPNLRHKHHEAGQCTKCDECTEWYHEVCPTAIQTTCEQLGCQPCRVHERRETKIHFGRYASGNAAIKSAHRRDKLIKEERVIGFEMEGAGAWEVLPTIVIKGVVNYADSHKNKRWRGYPAARAALCARAFIEEIELADPRDGHAAG